MNFWINSMKYEIKQDSWTILYVCIFIYVFFFFISVNSIWLIIKYGWWNKKFFLSKYRAWKISLSNISDIYYIIHF